MINSTALLAELENRNLIAQTTGEKELQEYLLGSSRTIYCGFDPTADSLHLGHLVPLLMLRRFQLAGHKPLALVGGGTGLIGDPSFKATERQLNTQETVLQWSHQLKVQIRRFIDCDSGSHAAKVVNNLEWIEKISILDFLRDIGKHFSVNMMIKKESVQQRINRDGAGISFTEFSYTLLQSMDFAELNRRYGCTVQIGGSDQWGNIVSGIDLTRRRNQQKAFGLTVPLVTKANGAKFGKTEKGAIWLDPQKTSAYSFYQFWLNTADADTIKYLKYFTFLDIDDINAIAAANKEKEGRKIAQNILAKEVTTLVHGDKGYQSAKRITEALFIGDITQLSEQDFQQLRQDGIPYTCCQRQELKEHSLAQLLVQVGMVHSGKQVKDALNRNAIICNDIFITKEQSISALQCFLKNEGLFQYFYLVKLGKKIHHLFEII